METDRPSLDGVLRNPEPNVQSKSYSRRRGAHGPDFWETHVEGVSFFTETVAWYESVEWTEETLKSRGRESSPLFCSSQSSSRLLYEVRPWKRIYRVDTVHDTSPNPFVSTYFVVEVVSECPNILIVPWGRQLDVK